MAAMQTEQSTEKQRRRVLSRSADVCFVVVALLLLYVLSTGPVILLEGWVESIPSRTENSPVGPLVSYPQWPEEAFEKFYSPLYHMPPCKLFDGLLSHYLELFGRAEQFKERRGAFLVEQAREALNEKKYASAIRLAEHAEMVGATYTLFEDRPELIREDVRRAMTKNDPTEFAQAQSLLHHARQALKEGNAALARELAENAERLDLVYRLGVDSPYDVLGDIRYFEKTAQHTVWQLIYTDEAVQHLPVVVERLQEEVE